MSGISINSFPSPSWNRNGLSERLADYRKTPEYQKQLKRQIQAAFDFARGEELVIYLDPSDEDKQKILEQEYPQAQIKLSDYAFSGGMRAVISGRNILIDNSFDTRLAEAKENFHFDLRMMADKAESGGNSLEGRA